MYELVLLLHSWLRWGAIVMGVLATVAAYRMTAGASAERAEKRGLILTMLLDTQLLLGVLLYFFLSPTTMAILQNFGAAMSDRPARFWAVEHETTMLVAIVAVHLGRVLARKATSIETRRRRLLVCFGLATIAMIAGTPWPGMPAGRPLFRFSF